MRIGDLARQVGVSTMTIANTATKTWSTFGY